MLSSINISIITVSKNSEKYLQETISSVASQTYKNIEYIIIDGASIDNSINIIKANEQNISYWVSEQDSGMYDAINKGLKLATGEYILILNSDDTLANNFVIENLSSEIEKENLDYYYGNIIKLKNGKSTKTKLFDVNYNELLFSTHGTFAPHPCFFISKKLNNILGGYNTQYKYASDYDYILRALQKGKGKHINHFVTKFRFHSESITASGKIETERICILKLHNYYKKSIIKRYFYLYFLWIYYKIINIRSNYLMGSE